MINHIDILRIVAVFMVFSLHSLLFTGKNFPMTDILNNSGGYFIFFMPAWGAVWIFFVISGFLAGKNWKAGKYKLNAQSIRSYYHKKIRRVYIPTVAFLFCFGILGHNLWVMTEHNLVFSIMTSTYNGKPAFTGSGATWYVFSLMWLYILVPLVYIIYNKINPVIVMVFFILLGVIVRLFFYKMGFDWYSMYTSPIMNMDLFICGFGVNYLYRYKESRVFKLILLFVFIDLILLNCYMQAFNWHMNIYRYLCESLYLVVTCLFLWMHDISNVYMNNVAAKYIKRFSNISFEFYLFHSYVFDRISTHIGGHTPIEQWLKFVIVGAIVTTILAIGWNRIFQIKE